MHINRLPIITGPSVVLYRRFEGNYRHNHFSETIVSTYRTIRCHHSQNATVLMYECVHMLKQYTNINTRLTF